MGKVMDFLLTESWEEYKRVQLYKQLEKNLEHLSPKQLDRVKKVLEEVEKGD